jgi:hypothetical protein
LLLGLALAAPARAAELQAPPEVVRALAGLVSADALGQAMVAYCQARAPQAAAPVRQAWLDWRIAQGVDDAHEELERVRVQRVVAPEGLHQQVTAKMAADGAPEAVCAGLAKGWASAPSMNLRAQFPQAYDADGTVRPLAAAYSGEPPHVRRPVGTVLSVAQLCALLKAQDGQRRAGGLLPELSGRIHLRGRVQADDDGKASLQHDEGPFRAGCSVGLSTQLKDNRWRDYDGHELVISGVVPSDPSPYWTGLHHARAVPDPGALRPASIDAREFLRRKPVDLARVRTAPGRGLRPQDLAGLLHGSESRPYNGSYQVEDHIALLLKDGSAMLQPHLPPEDLDVRASRELEPQRWGEWRAAGAGYEVRERDDHGRLAAQWKPLKGRFVPGWPAQHRLQASYETSAFYGSIALGGVFHRSALHFSSDGRYEGSHFSQGGSGSMAATAGFSGTATTVANGRGTSTSVGAGDGGSTVTSQQRRDDGADRRGQYQLGGYVLEIRYDSGRVQRLLSFPVGERGIWVKDEVYLRPGK